MRRVMVILLQERNLGPNVLYYVFVICLSLKGLPRAIQSIPSKPWRRATRQKYNQWGQKAKICSGIRQKYMLGQTGKNIWTGQARGFIKVGPVIAATSQHQWKTARATARLLSQRFRLCTRSPMSRARLASTPGTRNFRLRHILTFVCCVLRILYLCAL